MTTHLSNCNKLPTDQELIRAKCFHRAGKFIEFSRDEIEQSIPARFEKQVAICPDRIAVHSNGRPFSYADLNRMANRLAATVLAKRGNRSEPVALLLGHDAIMIASIIGVMKAGKICVPLETRSPVARLAAVLEDSNPELIVTNDSYLSVAAQLADEAKILNVDMLDGALTDANADLTIAPESLAFILYTSGSTGQPKGVTQTHRNALHSAMMYINNLHIEADDRVALFGSCSGGQGMKVVISALISGAAIYPWNIPEEGIVNLAKWLRAEAITIYISGATIFRSFITTLTDQEQFPELRIIRVGNEPIRQTDVELYRKHFAPHSIFINWFAVTEAGNVACYFVQDDPDAPRRYPHRLSMG